MQAAQVFHIQFWHGGSLAIKEQSLDGAIEAVKAQAELSNATMRLYDAHLNFLGKTVFDREAQVWNFKGVQ
jgi:hypothetical protein